MKNKVLITIVLSLFAIIIVPKLVFAKTAPEGEYYVCVNSGYWLTSEDFQYADPWWNDREYNKIVEEAPYSNNKKELTYKLYKEYNYHFLKKKSVCEDEVKDTDFSTEFDYETYIKYRNNGVINGKNYFSKERYNDSLEVKANEYLEELENAYKTVPSNNASANEIIKFVRSDQQYNNSDQLKNIENSKLDSWIKTIDAAGNDNPELRKDTYYPIKTLLTGYKNNDEEEIKQAEEKVSEETKKTIEANQTTANGGNNTSHGGDGGTFSNNYNQCGDDWWSCAWSFLNKGKNSEHQIGGSGVDSALSGIRSMIFDVGNVIFILVTAFLGVKYIWGGVDSKFSVKNSLMTLVVAAIVFYGWNAVTDILDIQGLLTGDTSASGVDGFVGVVYNTIMYIINFAAVGGIIYIGIRYMLAGADGKAEMKLKGIPIVMGIIMVYGTVNLINFILKIVKGL